MWRREGVGGVACGAREARATRRGFAAPLTPLALLLTKIVGFGILHAPTNSVNAGRCAIKDTEKHSAIMRAAAALFAKYGYKKTTVDEIVAAAGISKGLFYHYYPSKKELYLHLYDTYVAALAKSVETEIDTANPDFFERLKQISRLRVAFINRFPDLWHFLFAAYYEQHPDVAPEIQAKNNRLVQESYTGVAANIDWSHLKAGVTPSVAISAITWLAEGFVREVNSRRVVEDEAVYAEFDTYIELLRTGLYNARNGD